MNSYLRLRNKYLNISENLLQVRQSVLNADHTHFLLVDNGAQREYAEPAAIEFRADLEKELTNNGTFFK